VLNSAKSKLPEQDSESVQPRDIFFSTEAKQNVNREAADVH